MIKVLARIKTVGSSDNQDMSNAAYVHINPREVSSVITPETEGKGWYYVVCGNIIYQLEGLTTQSDAKRIIDIVDSYLKR